MVTVRGWHRALFLAAALNHRTTDRFSRGPACWPHPV
jgi:hypothetical protein